MTNHKSLFLNKIKNDYQYIIIENIKVLFGVQKLSNQNI